MRGGYICSRVPLLFARVVIVRNKMEENILHNRQPFKVRVVD